MIIRYFRSNQPALLLTLPVIGIVFWLIHFFAPEKFLNPTGFIFELIDNHYIIGSVLSKKIALLLIIWQAFLLNALLNKTEVFTKYTHIPLLLTIILASIFSNRGELEPAIFANIFTTLALNSLLTVYHQNSAIGLTFNIGFWIGMAGIFEPIYLLLILGAFISILILRAADWRELFFLLAGGFMPFALLLTFCFVTDIDYHFPPNYFQFHPTSIPHSESALFITFSSALVLLVMISFFYYLTSMRGIILRIRKMRFALFYFVLLLFLIYAFLFFNSAGNLPNETLLLPSAILLSFLYIHTTKTLLYDSLFYLLLIGWIVFVYNLYIIEGN